MFANKLTSLIYPLLVSFVAAGPLSGAASSGSSEFALYAYGEAVGGLTVFYRNGLAYLGDVSNATDAVPVNFTQYSTDSTSYVVTSANSSVVFNETLYLAINITGAANQPVSFSSADSGLTITGFKLFGQEIFYTSDETLITNWYAAAVDNETGVYALMWDAAQKSEGSNFPVGLRTTGPVSS